MSRQGRQVRLDDVTVSGGPAGDAVAAAVQRAIASALGTEDTEKRLAHLHDAITDEVAREVDR